MLDQPDQAGRRGGAHPGGVLPPGGQHGADDAGEGNAVIADGGDVLRDAEPGLRDGVEAADIGIVVGEKNTGRLFRLREQLLRDPAAALRIVEHALADPFVPDRDVQRLAGPVEASQTVERDRRLLAVDQGQTGRW